MVRHGMRVIKFRGRKESGDWVYGDLLTRPAHHSCCIVESGVINHSVDPKTVGQFTGLYDKDGKEIYEGDIVRFNWNPFFNEPSEIFTFEQDVQYYKDWGCFTMHLQSKRMTSKQFDLFQENGINDIHVAIGSPIMHGSGVCVIGNIHDNPGQSHESE